MHGQEPLPFWTAFTLQEANKRPPSGPPTVASFDADGQDPAHWGTIYVASGGISFSYGFGRGGIDKSRISAY